MARKREIVVEYEKELAIPPAAIELLCEEIARWASA